MSTRKKERRSGWELRFIKALRDTGNIRFSCQQADISRATVYRRRESDPAFAEQFDDAIDESNDVLELEARRRAVQGTEKLRVVRTGTDSKGRPIYEKFSEREYSDVMLIFLLKGKRPEVFRDGFDWSAVFAGISQATAQKITSGGEKG